MTFRDYRQHFVNTLEGKYDRGEAESFFNIILSSEFSLSRTDVALNPGMEIPSDKMPFLDNCLEQLQRFVPIQYILGNTQFCGLQFEVSPSVLIPRPETEELVEWVTSDCGEKDKGISILDIGTGSGCIAISLASALPDAEVCAMDISEDALAVARRNATLNGVEITFLHKDILSDIDLNRSFDVIVSNPPYVRNLEKEEIKENVLQFEPHLALFVEDDDALLFYRMIARFAKKHLRKGGWLYFEINQYLGSETSALLVSEGFVNVLLRKDIYGNDRMIRASYS